MKRFSSYLALTSGMMLGCGPELVASSAVGTSEASSKESGTSASEEEASVWLIVGALLATAAAFVTTLGMAEDGYGYVEEHQQDIQRALASGTGPFPSDLANGLGLPEAEVPRLAEVLRKARGSLAPTLEGDLDEGRVATFWRTLVAALEAEPVTAPRVAALRARAAQYVKR